MDLLFLSKRIYLGSADDCFLHGGIIVDTEGIIRRVLRTAHEVNSYMYNNESEAVYDFGDMILMPGLIDANVHVNEPGRKDWEGFQTATKAAAAGGITTIVDRPTNCQPATNSVASLKTKLSLARGKIYVDVGFWGGLVPSNTKELEPLLAAGVMGLQCSLCDTPEPVAGDFPAVSRQHLQEVLAKLPDEVVIAVHAEMPLEDSKKPNVDEPKQYKSYLDTRPPEMEVKAAQLVAELALANKKKHFHVLNISAKEVLPILKEAKTKGATVTAETCPHYLTLAAEDIEECRTEFKTQPPIRPQSNQTALWEGLASGQLDMISSDHSPATPGAKCLTYGRTRGDFLKAWPGISSLQLGLPVTWTQCQKHGFSISHIYRFMCWHPAVLCGLDSFKGKIAEGYDADFCVWNPDEEFTVNQDIIYSTNKATPYMTTRLRGVVHATVVRGLHVYQNYEGFGQPLGKVLLRKSSKKIVKFVRM